MAIIVPTITASDPHDYREQMERVTPFAARLHIDFADGKLAPTKLLDLSQAWLPEGKTIDFHLMVQKPSEFITEALKHQPQLIIIHAEAEDAQNVLLDLCGAPNKCGVALLPQTPVSTIHNWLAKIDHVLIFGGHLGFQGGQANLALLDKVSELRQLKSTLEIGWDGGVNDQNAQQIIEAGVDVLNVGSFIQQAEDPAHAYAKLLALAGSKYGEETIA